ncbi:hypothetical protein Ancab_031642 [Ancistrocladus abbreviatus]
MEPTPPAPQPTDPPPLPPQQPQQPTNPSPLPPPSSSLPMPISVADPSISSAVPPSNQIPNPSATANSTPKPPTSSLLQQQPQSQPSPQPQPQPPPHPQSSFENTQSSRPQFNNRPAWSQPPSHFAHFQPHIPPSSSSPVPSSALPPSVSAPPRGGIAIGFPANHPGSSAAQPPSLPSSFSSSFAPQYGGLARNPVNVPEPASNASPAARSSLQGLQGIGSMGSQLRSNVIPAHHQQRPVQSSTRPQLASNNQPTASQSFQGHGVLRAPSVGPSSSSTPSTSQGLQAQNQPWLSPGSHGRPPLTSPAFRPQMNPQSLQQRPHVVQQSHPMPSASQQLQSSSSQHQQQSFPSSNQSQEHHGQHLSSSRVPQSLSNQQLNTRVQVSGNQKAPPPAMMQPSSVQAAPNDRTAVVEADESGNRIVSKRSIQEIVSQVDPSEKLDPEVEDILVNIAEEFVDSITTFGCSLAKHRKSNMLEAKDILLHLERNWNMTLPGFSGDEIKTYKKPLTNDVHRERLAAIRKSITGTEVVNSKSSAGQAAGNVKGHLSKGPSSVMGS